MDRKIEIMVPHFLLGFSLAYFIGKGTPESVWALAISAMLWLLSMVIPRLCPLEKPTKLEAEIKHLEAQVEAMDKIVQANAEYSAKEFGTLKNVLQIKQMGMR